MPADPPPWASSPLLAPEAASLDIDAALTHYQQHGWAHLGPVASPDTTRALAARTDDLMLGRVVHDGLFFQLDAPSGRYEDLTYGLGWQGPTLAYRKLEKLEKDPLFLAWLENPLFAHIARRQIGPAVTIYRATIFSKAAHGGSDLPFHQDAGKFWGLDRDPHLQIWTALDDAPLEAGCLEIVSGSHLAGLATPTGGVVPSNLVALANAEARAIPVPAKRGDVLLIHNLVWHRSGPNRTDLPRRGFTVCYMDAATRCTRKKKQPRSFVRVFDR